MINMVVFSVFMLLSFLIFLLISGYMFLFNCGVFLEWSIFSLMTMNLEFIIYLDWISSIFISLVMLISSMIFIYSIVYMEGEKFLVRFMILVFMFIMSMVFMILSPNIFSILFGWDGLGLVSYCLVIYYQNFSSFNSGMITVLINRLGDIGLLMCIGMMMMYGSWNVYLLEKLDIIVLSLLLAAMTKSAQIPFSSWLPLAMAAPTPVSALVHSSTLVTAGVYLMIRFNSVLMLSGYNNILLFFSVLTMFMSGLMANVEFDLKKIIALSTLSQLGLMMMILSFGLSLISFYHLMTHAIFKSLLFMCAGIMIHSNGNNQDIRGYGSLSEFMPFTMMSFYISNLSLCGFPFLSGFYSKDLIMEMIYIMNVNIFMLIFIILSLSLTVSYSIRLFYYIFFGSMKFMMSFNFFKENWMMNLSMLILMVLSMVVGSGLSWVFFFDLYLSYMSVDLKLVTLIMCLCGIFISGMILILNFLKMYLNIYFMSSMWFLNYLMMIIYKPIFYLGLNYCMIDKVWMEYFSRLMVLNFLFSYSKFKVGAYNIYMFVMVFVYFLLMMIMMY